MKQTDHYVGSHLDISEKRIKHLANKILPWMEKAKSGKFPDACECTLVEKLSKLSTDPKEIALIAYQMGKFTTELKRQDLIHEIISTVN